MLIEAVPPTVAWVATAYKVFALWRSPRTPAARALGGTLVWLALATTLFYPPVYLLVGEVTGVPNLAILLAQSCGLIMLWPARNLLVYQRREPETACWIARRRYRTLPPLLLAQTVFWFLADRATNDPEYVLHGAGNGWVVAFCSIHHGALIVAGVDAIGPGWHVGSRMRGEFRLGMRVIAAAGVGAVLMVTYNATYFAASLMHVPRQAWGNAGLVMALMLYVSTSLLAVGATLPDWGPRVVRTLRTGRALHALHPMWRDLAAAVPGVVLPGAHARHELDLRLRRRVTEIRDAELALRQYAPAPAAVLTAAEHMGVRPGQLHAFTEAAVIAGGVQGRTRGVIPSASASPIDLAFGGTDLRSEVEWLLDVARHYTAARKMVASAEGNDAAPVQQA